MSASKKKQLRKGQNMTERQAAAASEAKKLKRVTLTFWVIIALVVCIFIGAVTINPIKNVLYKNVNTVQVGDHTLNAVQLNYFYMDAISSYVNKYSSYISYILDTTAPLSKQYIDEETGTTWADYFIESALSTIKSTYALYDAAVAAGYELSESEETEITSSIYTTWIYAVYYYGYSDLDTYLKAVYGNGANQENYTEYLRVSALASSYYNYVYDGLEFTADDLLDYQADAPYTYNSYSYAYYYVSYAYFLEDTSSATDEEKEAAREAAREAAEALAAGTYATAEEFEAAVKALDVEINEDVDTEEDSTAPKKFENVLYSSVTSALADWLIGNYDDDDVERQEGDVAAIPAISGSGDSAVTNGYYVVRFEGCSQNDYLMKNIRDILISFDAEDEDEPTDEEKEAALAIAEELLAKWQESEMTEEDFEKLVDEDTDDTVTDNGLYEDVYSGEYDDDFGSAFTVWCYDEARQAGDCEIVECEDGYHLIYFVGDSETTYRDSLIEADLRYETADDWHTELVEAVEAALLTDRFVKKNVVLSD